MVFFSDNFVASFFESAHVQKYAALFKILASRSRAKILISDQTLINNNLERLHFPLPRVFSYMFRNNGQLVLASGSPRRRHFLAELGLDFTVAVADVDEVLRSGESPSAFVSRLAQEKAAAIAVDHPGVWVIGADTVVVVADEVLGKPADSADALAMLTRLVGRSHEVWTGFAIIRASAVAVSRAVRTEVIFASASADVLAAYVASGEPLDKAGAYGIQGRGGLLVERIDGSYSNVVGLPMAELVAELLYLGAIAPADK
jgi:septum formation protein